MLSASSTLILILGAIAAGWGLSRVLSTSREDTWKGIAQELGLQFSKGHQPVTGVLNGVLNDVQLRVESRAPQGQRPTIELVAQLDADIPYRMHIRHKGISHDGTPPLQGTEFLTGDEELDAYFIFASSDPRALRELLKSSALKEALMAAHRSCRLLCVSQTEVFIKQRDITLGDTPQKLTRYIRLCATVASAIHHAAPQRMPRKASA